MSKITPEEVRRIAALANIGLEAGEVERMAAELDQIVGFVEQLQSVKTDGVEPTDQVTGLVDVWRPDEVYAESEKLSREELLANAPDQQDGFFKVKRVLDND
jgi:aspartyl-tRNA(Asn)/glutamyl-tRNA(Gln) amidotransferase subunit C